MNILRTARVVIIEDDDSEAAPLLLALSKLGIGAWHFTGDVDQLPLVPLEGVRVVFLDLRLSSTGPSVELKQILAHTLAVLEKVVGNSKGAVGIVYWTKDLADVEEFQSQLSNNLPGFRPSFIQRIESKLELLTAAADASGISSIADQLRTVLNPSPASHLLLEWEQAVHDAASLTTNLLTEAAESTGTTPDEALMQILALLAQSTGACGNVDGASAVSKLFESLNPIQFDQLEQLSVRRTAANGHAENLAGEIAKTAVLAPETKAKINGIFLSAKCGGNDPLFQPGAVFLRRQSSGSRCPHSHCDLRVPVMAEEMLDYTASKEIQQFQKQLNGEITAELRARVAQQLSVEKERIIRLCVPVLVEVTPACDFAQDKRSTARFIGGIMLPVNDSKLIKKRSQFIKYIEPVWLDDPEGYWAIFLNSRYVFGVTSVDQKLESRPSFRLRNSLLVDVLAWLGSQSARPGYMAVH